MSGFKLPGFGGKKTNIKRDMDRKYGHGDFASKEKRMRPGESKFNYDVRMRKQERGATTTPTTKPGSTYQAPDPNAVLPTIGSTTASYRNPAQKSSPGDLREQGRTTDIHLPSAPGDEWRYQWDQKNWLESGKLRAWDKDGNLHNVIPGSKADKAIRKRYTGSETGDLSSWYGHDTKEYTFTWDDTMGDEWNTEDTYTEKKSYLPYDLAQKHYNPKYKGSKK
jgi:hypothetical protein